MTEPIIQFSLRLRLADTGVRPAGAYLLAGSDVTEWLAEIGRWAMPMASLRLYVLPTSVRDITPAGTLVVLPDEGRPAPSPTAVAYSRFGENFYLPVDCDLFPAVSKSELRERLRGHLYVLHPTIGLVGFEPADAKVVHELLAPPIRKAANWACAHPGIAASPGLRSLTALPPDLDTLMEQARDDIHSEPTDGVPPSPGDSVPGPLGQAGLTIAQGLLGALSGLGKAFGKLFGSARGGGAGGGKQSGGKSAGGPGWLSRMMAGISERLQAARNREIARLMNLLKTNPDEGLRYALPFGGAAHRGLAKPGDRLTRRDVNFNLHGLGGGTPADVWEMPDDYRRHLANMYRQSAQREVGLGRYRRAAYIYAELLGDYHAAANVLVQGRHYREAAVLYKEHLHIPREAARCLEKGGLLAEAIVIYLELGEFETAGDLHTKLGNANAASAAYREAVTKYRDANDLLRAAGVLDEKLKSPDEAVDLLWSGWPDDLRAAECLGRRFALLGRLGRHDRVGRDVQLLRDQAYSTAHSRLLIDALVRLNQTYPDATLRTCSADAVRVVAARILPAAGPGDRAPVTNAVASLRPQDRLLRRDASRYCSTRPSQPQPLARPKQRDGSAVQSLARKITAIHSFPLPAGANWTTFAAADGLLYAAGFTEAGQKPALLYHDWRETHLEMIWSSHAGSRWPLFVAAAPNRRHTTLIGAADLRRLEVKAAKGTPNLTAGMPDFLPNTLVTAAYDRHGQVWAVSASGLSNMVLSCYGPGGRLVDSAGFDLPARYWETLARTGVLLLPHESGPWLAVGPALFRFADGSINLVQELSHPILSLSGSPPHTPPRIAVTLTEGGRIYWPGKAEDFERFAEGLIDPVATITNDGSLIAVTRGQGQVYQPRDGRHVLRFTFEGPAEQPLAVMQAQDVGQFAVVTATTVYLYSSRWP